MIDTLDRHGNMTQSTNYGYDRKKYPTDRFYSARIVKTDQEFFKSVKKVWFLGHFSKKAVFLIRKISVGERPEYPVNTYASKSTNYCFRADIEKDMTFELCSTLFRLDAYIPDAIVAVRYTKESPGVTYKLVGYHSASGKNKALKTQYLTDKQVKAAEKLINSWKHIIYKGRRILSGNDMTSYSYSDPYKEAASRKDELEIIFSLRDCKK